MAKSKQEKTGITFGSDFDIDERFVENKETKMTDEPYNCLKKQRVIVRYVPKTTGIVTDKNHVLYGGMTENAKRSFVLKVTEDGSYVDVLSRDEQRCLERAMGLNEGDLNPAKRENNFFSETNPRGISRVTLHKSDNIFDLSNPEDYIKVAILKTNDSRIAKSMNELQDNPLPTYQFVIINEEAETNRVATKLNNKTQAWVQFGTIKDDIDKLRVILSVFERKQIGPTTKLGFLQEKIIDYVENDPKTFLKIVTDKYFDTRVTIQKAIDKGIVTKRGTYYYEKETNTPLCENGEDPTLTNACKYLNMAKNDSVKFRIESKIVSQQ